MWRAILAMPDANHTSSATASAPAGPPCLTPTACS